MKPSTYGYAGLILRVDLTTLQYGLEASDNYVPKFLGGRGLNQWLLLQELRPRVTPFEPANILCFGAGALVGTLVPGASRLNVDSKNALTPGIGSGNAGGWFASELKFAGYDTVLVQGKAREPVYLYIEDDKISFKPAKKLWGKTTTETMKLIQEDVDRDDVQVLCIGPAGENVVRTACIVVSGARAAGRCGLGAIMGSKNLKAIAVRGTGTIATKQPEEFMSLVETVSQRLRGQTAARVRKELGTPAVNSLHNEVSGIPYRNFEDEYVPGDNFAKVSAEVFHNRYSIDRYACTACPCSCGHVYIVENGLYAGTECHKLEANAVWDFGARLGIDDASSILRAQEECCQLGLDMDNTGSVIAWAIDCYQNELLSRENTDGLELEWGDHHVVTELLRKIAFREGFGNVLAEGSLRASQLVGKGSEKYSFTIKGQDLVEGIRSCKGWALGVVTSARGATHTRGAPYSEFRKWSSEESQRTFGVETAGKPTSYVGKARVVWYYNSVHPLWDSLGICFIMGNWSSPEGITPRELAQFYSLATGIEVSEGELIKIGQRIHNVEKMFNVYHAGFTRIDDYPPKRLMEEPIKSGPLKGELLNRRDWDAMLDDYYELHGWDKDTSWPTAEKLGELNLQECIEILERGKQVHIGKPLAGKKKG